MQITEADSISSALWNEFIKNHYPPVGNFMMTHEWSQFQESLGRQTKRYVVRDPNKKTVAAFILVSHRLPGGLTYGYVPRGPVFHEEIVKHNQVSEVLIAIKDFVKNRMPDLIFLRLEPALEELPLELPEEEFLRPNYYIQPRYNLAVNLNKSEAEILGNFHPSTRSNVQRALRRGVTVRLKSRLTEEDYQQFFLMIKQTIRRNSGVNAYPSEAYFGSLLKTIPNLVKGSESTQLTLGIFFGYQGEAVAGAHFVLFFGETATYLYGASYSDKLSSKVTTYLHYSAMLEAKKRGLKYYDLGGIDEKRWPSLTTFKRQFKGEEFSYMGNLDIPLRPFFYRVYNLVRNIRGLFRS